MKDTGIVLTNTQTKGKKPKYPSNDIVTIIVIIALIIDVSFIVPSRIFQQERLAEFYVDAKIWLYNSGSSFERHD